MGPHADRTVQGPGQGRGPSVETRLPLCFTIPLGSRPPALLGGSSLSESTAEALCFYHPRVDQQNSWDIIRHNSDFVCQFPVDIYSVRVTFLTP